MRKPAVYSIACVLCGALVISTALAESVALKLLAPEAREVYVAGSFDSYWQKLHPMRKLASGRWEVVMDLPPGRYELQYLVEGKWMHDPQQPSVEDGLGGRNNILIVPPEKQM